MFIVVLEMFCLMFGVFLVNWLDDWLMGVVVLVMVVCFFGLLLVFFALFMFEVFEFEFSESVSVSELLLIGFFFGF